MKKFLVASLACAVTLLSNSAFAFDAAKYKELTDTTIRELIAGSIPDLPATLARLQAAMAIGVKACDERIKAHPEDAALLGKVVAEAPGMTKMSAQALENLWGDEGTAGDSVNRPLKSIDSGGVVRGFLDIIVHPARSYDLISIYAKTKDAAALAEAKGELLESLEHLKKASAAQ